VLDVFHWLKIEFLESTNLYQIDPHFTTSWPALAWLPADKLSILKTFSVQIKHFMSKSTQMCQILSISGKNSKLKWLQDNVSVEFDTALRCFEFPWKKQ